MLGVAVLAALSAARSLALDDDYWWAQAIAAGLLLFSALSMTAAIRVTDEREQS